MDISVDRPRTPPGREPQSAEQRAGAREPARAAPAPLAVATPSAADSVLVPDVAQRVAGLLANADALSLAQVSRDWRDAVTATHPHRRERRLEAFLRAQPAAASVSDSIARLAGHPRLSTWLPEARQLRLHALAMSPADVATLARHCPNLEELHLEDNTLDALPPELFDLTHLTRLTVRHNHLTELPDALGRLTDLHHLNLVSNHLGALPDVFDKLTHLDTLAVVNNPSLRVLPPTLSSGTPPRQLFTRGSGLDSLRGPR